MIETLPAVFRTVMKKYNLAPGDFPDIRDFQDKLSEMDFTKFHGLKQKLIDDIEGVLGNDIPRLMEGKNDSISYNIIGCRHLTFTYLLEYLTFLFFNDVIHIIVFPTLISYQ